MIHARARTGLRSRAFLLSLASLVLPSTIHAQDAPRTLRIDAPTACDGASHFRARLDALLSGADVAEMPAIDVALTIVETEEGFRGALLVREGPVETPHALVDRRCDVVVDAAALVIALALVPGLALDDAPPLDDAPAAAGSDEPPIDAAATRVTGALRLGAHGAVGALPGVVVGGELAGAIVIDWARIELGARGTPFAGARIDAAGAIGGDLALATALVRGCGAGAPDPRLELGGCVGMEAGAAFGRGVGISAPTDASAPWVAVEAAVRMAWVPWPFLALVLEVQAVVPVVRPVFTVTGLGVVYRPAPVSGALQLGLELRFP